jgi:CBS domain-containing protein
MADLMARDVMTTEVHTVRAETPLEEIASLLAAHHISGVPVVDDEHHVIGVVSEADLIDEHKREARIPRVALYGVLPIADEILVEAARHGMALPARELMSRKLVTATEETPVHELADLMASHKVNRIPIVREGRLVGIVCRADLVRALTRANGTAR